AAFAVDEEPQHGVSAARGVLELHQLIAHASEHRLDEGNQPLTQGPHHDSNPPEGAAARPQTKMGLQAHQKNKSPAGGLPYMRSSGVPLVETCRPRHQPPVPDIRSKLAGAAHSTGTTPRVGTAPQSRSWPAAPPAGAAAMDLY